MVCLNLFLTVNQKNSIQTINEFLICHVGYLALEINSLILNTCNVQLQILKKIAVLMIKCSGKFSHKIFYMCV